MGNLFVYLLPFVLLLQLPSAAAIATNSGLKFSTWLIFIITFIFLPLPLTSTAKGLGTVEYGLCRT